jgi:hypothetical protein
MMEKANITEEEKIAMEWYDHDNAVEHLYLVNVVSKRHKDSRET